MAERSLPGSTGISDSISELTGLGPKSQEILALAGIATSDELRDLGAVAAFFRARRASPAVSLNLLWAREGAISGESWQVVAREHRTSLLLALEEMEKNF